MGPALEGAAQLFLQLLPQLHAELGGQENERHHG
jgi:hypothetical protein